MSRLGRFLLPLAILLFGVIMIPYFTWPDEAFSWQNFADAYGYGYGITSNR